MNILRSINKGDNLWIKVESKMKQFEGYDFIERENFKIASICEDLGVEME